jgi:hypothetical protein
MDASSHRPVTRLAQSAWVAALLFFGLTIAVTWPLAPGLGRDVPSDYGDPLYVAWALAWVMRQMGRALTGHLDAVTHFFDANQLHPEPGTLALSDHFVGQALPLAPVYWITGNAVLTLGLAYIVALTLCGFSMWLLVRELTGSSAAGVLAGTVFAFNEFFLIFELAHLQVLSAHWMPLALYGFRRYFAHGSRAGLALAALSVIALNLSAGYYLLMFPPFAGLYVCWELTARGRWRDRATWRDLAIAGAAIMLFTAPFLWPYIEAQRRMGFKRTLGDTAAMAASVDGYLDAGHRLFAAYACALLAVIAAIAGRVRRAAPPLPLAGFLTVAMVIAFWLSLGPTPRWGSETYPTLGLYRALQHSVPGMDAIRVSSRFAVVFLVFLSALAGTGAALIARLPRLGVPIVLTLAASTIWATVPRPFPLNRQSPSDVNAPAAYLTPGPVAPQVYRYLASLPKSAVIAELPFIDLWYNTRYLYFSTFHWRRTVNGFTSFYPASYTERAPWLVNPVRTPDEAWRALTSGGTTHVVVHTGAWDAEYVRQLDEWLTSRGARSHGAFDGAVVYEMPAAATATR